jgi:hypothetical protein
VPNPPELFFNFRANAGAMRRIGVPVARPTFAGELGSWGLYQMNFVIPEIPSGLNLPTCEEGPTDSNLTVLVVGQTSSDSLRMCIRP